MTNPNIKRALFLFPTDVMGGAENVTRMLAQAALKSNLFDEVICFVLSQQDRGTLTYLTEDSRTTLIYSGARSEKGSLYKLMRLFATQPYDLVFSSHTHVNSAASLMRKLKVLKTRKLISRESTMIFERKMGLRGWLVRQLYQFYGGQDLIICQTDRMKNSLRLNTKNRFSNRVQTIPNPIDLDAIKNALKSPISVPDLAPSSDQKIVWCGRLSNVKSPLRAVDTLRELHIEGRTNAHLIMIGDGPMRSEILEHAQANGLEKHVTLTGRVNSPSTIMQNCELGLMTSDTEGFPNVILEMLASGVRSVVTTDCAGGLVEIPGVHVAESKTATSLAQELAVRFEKKEPDSRINDYLQQRDPSNFLRRLLK